MSCPNHSQWYHAREDCPFCLAEGGQSISTLTKELAEARAALAAQEQVPRGSIELFQFGVKTLKRAEAAEAKVEALEGVLRQVREWIEPIREFVVGEDFDFDGFAHIEDEHENAKHAIDQIEALVALPDPVKEQKP